jgi:exopolysaccharide biosynthesis protein
MHIIRIDLTAPGIRFHLTPPGGDRETVRQTTLEFLQHEHAQIAINVHFFLPFPSSDSTAWLVGLAASDGEVYSACETPSQSYAIVSNAPALNIDAGNHASIVRCGANVALWNTVSGSAQIVTNGIKTIPEYGAALTPSDTYSAAGSWYDRINARTVIGLSGDTRTLTLFTVDRAGGSLGMPVGEVADLLIRDYGVFNALNLDGGGSTTLAMQDPKTHAATMVNASSDSPGGRAVGSNLAVFAPLR